MAEGLGISPEYIPPIPVLNTTTSYDYVISRRPFQRLEFEAMDYLVMTTVLLISVGLSISKTMSRRRDVDELSEEKKMSEAASVISPDSTNSQTLIEIFSSAAATTSPFVNTLCLFGLTGEIFKHGSAVIFFLIGLFLSILALAVLKFFSIIAKNKMASFPAYLKMRFQRKGISSIVAFSSILRHFMGGALNLCAIGIGVSAMTDLSALIVSMFIAAMAVFCSSMSRIRSGNNESIGGILIWLVGMTCLVTLTVTTSKEGGFSKLFSKANALGKLNLPSVSPLPWEMNSVWGFLTIGVILGFQIFAFSRSTLRHAIDLPRKYFFSSVFATFFLIVLWTFIGFWAGICVSVTFEGVKVLLPDSLMAELVSKEMEDIRGFRGFFVSTLIAASVSGQTRRYNQLIELIWETGSVLFESSERREQEAFSEKVKSLPDEYVKELNWERRKKTCMFHFIFKIWVGLAIGTLSCGVVVGFHSLSITVWELWQGVVGIFIGPLVAAMLIGLFLPCVSHMSVCLGLLIGWAIPCYLIIGNYSTAIEPAQLVGAKLTPGVGLTPPEKRVLTVNGVNYTLEETVYVVFEKGEYKAVSNEERIASINNKLEEVYTDQSDIERFLPKVIRRRRSERSLSSGNSVLLTLFLENRPKRSKLVATNYCFYGPIGTIACILSSLLFAGVSGKCNFTVSSTSFELLHPFVKKYCFIIVTEEDPTPPPIQTTDPTKRNKINALKFIQETANI